MEYKEEKCVKIHTCDLDQRPPQPPPNCFFFFVSLIKFTIITQQLTSDIRSETTNAINEITDEKKINLIRLSFLYFLGILM